MKFFKNFSIYFGADFINKIIPFLLLPVITKYLTPTEFGIYGMYQVLLTFLSPFIIMSLQTNVTRNFFKVSKEKLSQIIASVLLILHINVFMSFLVVAIISIFFEYPFGVSSHILYIMPLILYVQTINAFNLTILRNEEKALQYGYIQVFITIINYSVVVMLLLFLEEGWTSFVYGAFIAHFIVAVYSILLIKNKYSFGYGLYPLKEIYAISIPLIFHSLGGSIIFLSDRIFIEKMLSLKEVGIYSIGIQFGTITMIIIGIVLTTLNPSIYRNLAQNNQKIVKKMYFLMISFLVLSVVVAVIANFIFPYMINKKYQLGSSVILWASLTYGVRGLYQIFHSVIVHEGKTKILMYITFGSGILNLLLNYFFIEVNGMIGAIQATFVTYIFICIFTFYYANKYSQLKWI